MLKITSFISLCCLYNSLFCFFFKFVQCVLSLLKHLVHFYITKHDTPFNRACTKYSLYLLQLGSKIYPQKGIGDLVRDYDSLIYGEHEVGGGKRRRQTLRLCLYYYWLQWCTSVCMDYNHHHWFLVKLMSPNGAISSRGLNSLLNSAGYRSDPLDKPNVIVHGNLNNINTQ